MTRELTFDDYLQDRMARDPKFRELWERDRPLRELSKAIIGARIAKGWSQRELAAKMGTKQSAIARLESGNQVPTLTTLFKLAQVLGVEFTITPDERLTSKPHEQAA